MSASTPSQEQLLCVRVRRLGNCARNFHCNSGSIMTTTPEIIDQDRRRLLRTTIVGFAAVSAASLAPSQLIAAPASDAIRPFRVHVPDEQLADLRRRILATRWP